MSYIAVILIIASALFHITWNFILKKVACDSFYIIYVYLLTSLIFSPILFIYRSEVKFIVPLLPLLLWSSFYKGLSNWTLMKSYKLGDYSYMYPMRNALPIVFSCIYGVILGNSGKISPVAYIGFFLILIGCLLMPLRNIKQLSIKNYLNGAFIFVVVSSVATAGYTIIDSEITKDFLSMSTLGQIKTAFFLIPVLYFILAFFMIPFIFIDKYLFKDYVKLDKNKTNYKFKHILIHALCMSIGYIFVLIAFTLAKDVSYIIAFRQVGMPLSFVIGYFILKEKIYFGKFWGLLSIIIGLVMSVF